MSGTKATVDTGFFSGLGAANAARSEDLRPSEGGKYGGFGSDGQSFTPSGTTGAYATSSKAMPTFDDIRSNPGGAFSKGWGLFSSVSLTPSRPQQPCVLIPDNLRPQALTQAGSHINDSVIQPGVSRASDPALQAQMSDYWTKAGGVVQDGAKQGGGFLSGALRAGGQFANQRLDLNVGDMGASYVDKHVSGRCADQNLLFM